jgi:hypothetical protein
MSVNTIILNVEQGKISLDFKINVGFHILLSDIIPDI